MFLCLVTKGDAVRLSEILFYASPLRGVKAFFHYPDTSLSPQREEAGRGRVLTTSKNNIPATLSEPPDTRSKEILAVLLRQSLPGCRIAHFAEK